MIPWYSKSSLGVRTGILSIIILLFLIGSLYLIGKNSQNNFLREEIKETVQENKSQLELLKKHDIELLSASLEVFVQDKEIKQAFLSGNRDVLYSRVQAVAATLQEKYGIGSIEFISPDNIVFLRTQNRDYYGDKLSLSSLEEAKKNNAIGSALEIGPLQLALRVVSPYYSDDGKLIGYVMFTENVDRFLRILESETGSTFALFANKKYFNKAILDTTSGNNTQLLLQNWDKYLYFILANNIDSSGDVQSRCFTENYVTQIINNKLTSELVIRSNDRDYTCAGFPLYDPTGTVLGAVMYTEDVTNTYTTVNNFGLFMIEILLIGILLLAGIMQFIMRKIVIIPLEKIKAVMDKISGGDLTARVPVLSHDELGDLSMTFNSMTDKIAELNNMKDEFLSVAAHQLRTPLGSIRWNLEMLLHEDFGKLSSKMKEVLEQLYHSNLRLINLVNGLLDVSRIDQKRVVINPQPIDIISSARQALKEFEIDIKKKSIKALLKVENKIPLLTLDAIHFHEVCENLLSNAIKYNKKNGSITITVTKKDEYVHVVLQDTGIGIPEKEQHKMFSKFFRASNAVLADTEGTGLGLFVVKSYVEGCGGNISFTSKEGEGTTFTIKIPVVTTFDKQKQNKKI